MSNTHSDCELLKQRTLTIVNTELSPTTKLQMAAAAAAFVKPPEEIQLSTGNPARSWGKWKRRFEIYIRATGSSTQPGAQKVGLLLNHIGDAGIEIYANSMKSTTKMTLPLL